MRIFKLAGFLLLLALAGCNQSALMEKIAGPENDRIAQSYIAQLRANKFDLIERNLDPSIQNDNIAQKLAKMAALFPAGEPVSIKLVGAHYFKTPSVYKINLVYEYEFPGAWAVTNVGLQQKDGVSTIYDFHVQQLSESLEHLNRFTLRDRHPLQYAVLALAVLIPLFILYSLVACIRTRMGKGKWLWILFILFGLGRVSVDWTTGGWSYQLVSLQLFGAGAVASLYSAWVISISSPAGAIAFLLSRKQLTKGLTAAAPVAELPPRV